MIVGLFSTPEDTPYLTRFQALVGAHAIKRASLPEEYLTNFAMKVRKVGLEAVIVTCPVTLVTLLTALPDFKHPRDKRGTKKRLSLNDYAGSFFYIPGNKLGIEYDLPILVLNPLQHLVSTAEGPFVFKRFLSKLFAPTKWFPQTAFTWELWKPATAEAIYQRFSTARLLSVDIETYVGDPERRIHCVGYCALFPDGTTHAVVVPFKDMLAHAFVRRLNATQVPKVFQNGMYDNLYFLRWNAPVVNWLHDTQHMFHSWYSELPKRLDFITAFMVREIRYWKDDSAGGEYELFEYNAKDCWTTLLSYCALVLEAPEWARTNYLQEFPLVFPCLSMEVDGLSLDKQRFDVAKAKAELALTEQRDKLVPWFGPRFNPASPVQVADLLRVLGVSKVESADAKALNAAASVHPFNMLVLSAILAYRKQAKLLSTYYVWDKFWHGRLFYRTNPAGTETGRMASTESSFWTGLQIQNIPQGYAVKSWIATDEGWDGMAEGDYAQSEARCVGYLSGCKSLIDLVESDKDFHKHNASAFFGVPYEAIDKPLRDLAKRVNHGANYNMGSGVLLETMGPTKVAEARALLRLPGNWSLLQVCDHLLRAFARTYPEIKSGWYADLLRTVKMTSKLVSPLGWTRHFFADPSKDKRALNALIAHSPQNLSVAIINRVFYKVWYESMYGELRGIVRLKAQIHDSLLFCFKGPDTPERVRKMMEHAIPVTDCNGVTRTMLIPPDMSAGNGKAKYWADLK